MCQYGIIGTGGAIASHGNPGGAESPIAGRFGNNANEPFAIGYKSLDFDAALVEAGITAANLFRATREAVCPEGQLPPVTLVGAVKD